MLEATDFISVASLKMGWMTGLEPATPRATIWCSSQAELHPPQLNSKWSRIGIIQY